MQITDICPSLQEVLKRDYDQAMPLIKQYIMDVEFKID